MKKTQKNQQKKKKKQKMWWYLNDTRWPDQSQIQYRAQRKVGSVPGNPLRSATNVSGSPT